MIVLLGVIFFYGLLTYIILDREKENILDLYKQNAMQSANLVAEDLIYMMTRENPEVVADNIEALNKAKEVVIGVADKDGSPAFNTHITVPKEIFDSQKEHYLVSGQRIYFL